MPGSCEFSCEPGCLTGVSAVAPVGAGHGPVPPLNMPLFAPHAAQYAAKPPRVFPKVILIVVFQLIAMGQFG